MLAKMKTLVALFGVLLLHLAYTEVLAYSYGYHDDYRTCILKSYYRREVENDYADDEPFAEENEPKGHHYGHNYGHGYGKHTVKLQVVHRCGYKLCHSYKPKIYIYSGYSKKLCRSYGAYSKKRRTITCHVYGARPTKIVIYWPKYGRHLTIYKLRTGKVIRAVMPMYKSKKMKYSSLRYCRSFRNSKTILITVEVQGKVCPTGRRRFPLGSVQSFKDSIKALDGRLNNKKKIFLGAAGENFKRLAGDAYVDGISVPAGACTVEQIETDTCPFPAEFNGTGSNRPNPRMISNVLLAQSKSIPSKRGVADLLTYFGQFLDHDLDLGEPLPEDAIQINPNDLDLPIPVPKGDLFLDADKTGNQSIPLRRFSFDLCTGNAKCQCPREQVNIISSFIDAGTVYGTDEERLKVLRTFKDGLLVTDNGNLPLNTFGMPNENPINRDPTMLRFAGDIRSNTAPTLLVLHTLFVLEHNRLAKEYQKKHYKATDEEIFQFARKIVIAEIQAIVFNEFLPTLLGGKENIPKYKGYNPKVNPTIATEHAHAAFRFGHTQINTFVFRRDKKGKLSKFGDILLREGFFRPERVTEEGGIDPILRGSIMMPTQEIDTQVVDELRNFLFPGAGTPLDLTAINIQRGRELGLPDFNTVRKKIGLKPFKTFDEITKEKKVAATLKYLYGSVDLIDLWIGCIAEDNEPGSEFGETLRTIIVDQLVRVRDGDRFWYLNLLTKKEIALVESLTLGKIIELNTKVRTQENVFFASSVCKAVKDFQCIRRKPYGHYY